MKDKQDKQDKKYHVSTALKILKEELATREDNTNVGSGLGGNLRQYFWLLINGIDLKEDTSLLDQKIDALKLREDIKKDPSLTSANGPEFRIIDNRLYLVYNELRKSTSILELRQKLDKFIEDNSIQLPDITYEQITDIDYMDQYRGKSIQLDIFRKCLAYSYKLIKLLRDSDSLRAGIEAKCAEEKTALAIDFAKEYDLSFENDKDRALVISMIAGHKAYCPRLNDINTRRDQMISNCMGYAEKKYLDFLNSAPMFLSIPPIRRIIQINNIVKYNLGDYLTMRMAEDEPDEE